MSARALDQTVVDLLGLAAELNEQGWGGRLPLEADLIRLYRVDAISDGGVLYGYFTPSRAQGLPSVILVLHGLPPDFEREVLFHELAHFAVYLETGNPGAHNADFVEEMRRLARRGAPGAEQWARPDSLRWA